MSKGSISSLTSPSSSPCSIHLSFHSAHRYCVSTSEVVHYRRLCSTGGECLANELLREEPRILTLTQELMSCLCTRAESSPRHNSAQGSISLCLAGLNVTFETLEDAGEAEDEVGQGQIHGLADLLD
jgi:hypothetical protein